MQGMMGEKDLYAALDSAIEYAEKWMDFLKKFYKDNPAIKHADFFIIEVEFYYLELNVFSDSVKNYSTKEFEMCLERLKKEAGDIVQSNQSIVEKALKSAVLIRKLAYFSTDIATWGQKLCDALGIDSYQFEIYAELYDEVHEHTKESQEQGENSDKKEDNLKYYFEEYEFLKEQEQEQEEIIDPLPKRYEPEFTATNITYKASE